MSDQSILSIEEETWSICGQNLMIFNWADYIMSKKGKTFSKYIDWGEKEQKLFFQLVL